MRRATSLLRVHRHRLPLDPCGGLRSCHSASGGSAPAGSEGGGGGGGSGGSRSSSGAATDGGGGGSRSSSGAATDGGGGGSRSSSNRSEMQPNGRAQDDRGGLDSFRACIRRATGTDARTGSLGPDVRVVSPSALAANAAEHERVLSLLPVQARSRLLAAGSLGHCSMDVHQRVPLEASSGVGLLTLTLTLALTLALALTLTLPRPNSDH